MTLSSDSIPSRPGSDPTNVPIAKARAALLWERVWARLWPASGILAVVLAAALAGAFEPLPWFLHALVIASAVTLMGLALERSFRDFRVPGWSDGARRIERDSALSDRPITEGRDVLAAGRGDTWAEALWNETLRRRLLAAKGLRVSWPSPRLSERDPRALRYLALLLVAAAAIVANGDWRERLGRAFLASENVSGLAAGVDAWIDPPPYTGRAPVYLSPAMRETIVVPAGSRLNIRIHGSSYTPIVTLSPSPREGGGVSGRNGEFSSTAVLGRDSDVRVRTSGRTLGEWSLKVVPDSPPAIAFNGKPVKTERSVLRIPFKAADDYGVTSVRAIVQPVGKPGAPLSVELGISSGKLVDQAVFQDFSEHAYAGLNVTMVLEARDGLGQTARSAALTVKLPARVFTNPLARAAVEQRQVLASDPKGRPRVMTALEALTVAPELFYPEQASIYFALRTAFHALKNAKRREDLQRVQDLLWQTALALEQGGLLNAAMELRRIQQQLAQALASGADQEVIDALLERYRQAMERYLQLLAQNPDAAPPPDMQAQGGGSSVGMDQIQALLKLIQQLSAAGDQEGAARALAFLQTLLENLRMAQGGGGGGSGMSPQAKALADKLKKLGDLMGEERDLADKTYREGQGSGDPKDGGAKGLGQRQGDIRKKLDDVMKGMGGKDPGKDKLDGAGREMGSAQNQLDGGNTEGALEAEKRALDAMRNGADALSEKLSKQMAKDRGQGEGGAEDPMGRMQGSRGPNLGQGVKVPAESELQRARRILEELRRRAAERGRPQEELDYIDRLLKQF